MVNRPSDMHPVTWRVLQALRSGAPLSRNRNFSLFRDPNARRGLRIYRYLQSVIADVRAHADSLSVQEIDVDNATGEFALRLDFPVVHGHRTAYLRASELLLIAQAAPEVAALISQHPTSA
jgi:hypothetical protein